jgi:hypothetical protein
VPSVEDRHKAQGTRRKAKGKTAFHHGVTEDTEFKPYRYTSFPSRRESMIDAFHLWESGYLKNADWTIEHGKY